MGRLLAILRQWVLVFMLAALGAAPVATALTHGPGAIAAQADHAAYHAEQKVAQPTAQHKPAHALFDRGATGGHAGGHAGGHGPHDATDHDHSASVILTSPTMLDPFGLGDDWRGQGRQMTSIIHDGPKRPPRAPKPFV